MASKFKIRDYLKVAGWCCLVLAILAVPVGVFAAIISAIVQITTKLLGGLVCT